MRLNQILTEAEQQEIQTLQEGPILNKIGSAVGKGVGTLAKGVGAVAGGVVGIGKALKKGYQAGKDTVGGAGDEEPATASTSGKPAAQGATNPTAAGSQGNAGAGAAGAQQATGQSGSPRAAAKPAASATPGQKPATFGSSTGTAFKQGVAQATGQDASATAQGTAKPAAGKPASSAANDSAYAQAQKAVNGLPPEQKKEVIAMLQADPKVKAAMSKPEANKPVESPAAPSTKPTVKKPATVKTGTVQQKQLTPAGFGQMLGGLTKKAG